MNSTRSATVPSRPPQYDENLFQMMGKGFNETSNHSIPNSSPTSQIPSSTNTSDQYQQIRQATASAVFDPSDFPSLGGALSTSNNVSINPSSILNNGSNIATSNLGTSQTPNIAMNGLSHYPDPYSNVPGFKDNRTKAVDALTGSSTATEFNMQNEDFPALGGAPGANSIRASSVLANALQPSAFSSGNSAPNGNTTTERQNNSDSLFDSNTSIPQVILGRGKTRSDQQYSSRAAFMANGVQVPDSRQTQQSIDRTNALSFPYGQRQKQPVDLATSPSKLLGPNNITSFMAHRTRAQLSSEPISADTNPVDNMRGTSEADRNIMKVLANGSSIGPEAFSNGAPRKYPPDTQSESPLMVLPKKPEDQLKLQGLLPIVRPLLSGKTENVLSVGLDLTALGLNLTSPEPLYRTFENPWDQSNHVVRSHEPEYKLPSCYYMQPPALGMSHFSKFQLETLFYIFYNMPKDILQILAAEELYNKKWMYHKVLKLWFTCNSEAMQGYESAGYIYFDIKSWEKRPFRDANQSFIQGLMKEEELKDFKVPSP